MTASSFPLSCARVRSHGGNYRHASGDGFGGCLRLVRGMRAHCAIGPYKSISGDHRGRRMHGATRSAGNRPHRRATVPVSFRTRYRGRPKLVVIVPIARAANVDGLDEHTSPNSRNVARTTDGKRENEEWPRRAAARLPFNSCRGKRRRRTVTRLPDNRSGIEAAHPSTQS
jgi:hypothetical protein